MYSSGIEIRACMLHAQSDFKVPIGACSHVIHRRRAGGEGAPRRLASQSSGSYTPYGPVHGVHGGLVVGRFYGEDSAFNTPPLTGTPQLHHVGLRASKVLEKKIFFEHFCIVKKVRINM